MDDISRLRKRVDEIDNQILTILHERVNVCRDIGLAKKKQNIPIRNTTRENEIYRRIKRKASQMALDVDKVQAVFREIVNMCSSVQE